MNDEILKEILSELKNINTKLDTLGKGVNTEKDETVKERKITDVKGFTKDNRHIIEIYYDNGEMSEELFEKSGEMLQRLENLWSFLDSNKARKLLDDR